MQSSQQRGHEIMVISSKLSYIHMIARTYIQRALNNEENRKY